MVFACQTNSFLKEYKCKVISCVEAELDLVENGKKSTLKGYEVIFNDTILFPEGGGQPCDKGVVNDIDVIQVTRKGAEAVHFLTKPLEHGQIVTQYLDWNRRHDHMQQHSGQHLISALGENVFNYNTTSWWLGAETSYVELDTTKLLQSEVDKWEFLANEKIREALPVTVSLYERDDPSLLEAHSRGLPEDHVGPVRVINIKGIDTNMCCGTHVTSLSQLQMIKFLYFEKGKKNKTNLHFLVGCRVLKHMNAMINRENLLTALLKNGPDFHAELVDKLQKNMKLVNKKLTSTLKDLAQYEAKAFLSLNPAPKWYSLHRSEGDSDFMRLFINEVGKEDTLLFVTVGEEKGAGQMTLYGDPNLVSKLGPKICELLEGKGAGKGPKFQAKISNLSKRNKAEELIKAHFGIE